MNKEQNYIGVDISKDNLDIAVYGSKNRWRFTNNMPGIKQAIDLFKNMLPVLVIFEATGGLELSFWAALTEADIDAVLVNPRQIRDFAKAGGKLAKTDTLDAKQCSQSRSLFPIHRT